jgi:hypothetical protein
MYDYFSWPVAVAGIDCQLIVPVGKSDRVEFSMAKKKNGEAVEVDVKSNANREAVSQAMEVLGNKAKASEMAAYIKDKFNLEIENKVIGIHRHHILKGRGKKAGVAPRKAGRPAGGGGDVSLAEIRAVKELVSRHGAKRVLEMIELLS